MSQSDQIIKPMIILELGVMDEKHQQMLRDNGICVVEAKDPAKIKFCDSVAATSSRSQIENAAIALSRRLLNGKHNWTPDTTSTFARMFVDCLVKGTPLDWREEEQAAFFESEKRAELARLAREEAKAERAAAKKAK